MRASPVWLLTCTTLCGCVPSNVVASTDRVVLIEAERAVWRAGTRADLPGLWRSGPMTGALATTLLHVDYFFADDGSFTGAALFAGPPAGFQVLQGNWRLDDDGRLRLDDDAEPARLEVADGMLRISGGDGTVVLYREALR